MTVSDEGSVVWIEEDAQSSKKVLKINPNQEFDIYESELKGNRRVFTIPLAETQADFRITGVNFFGFKDLITGADIMGSIVAVAPKLTTSSSATNGSIKPTSNKSEVATKLVFFGKFLSYGNVSGHLDDSLDLEDPVTSELFYIGNVGNFPVYVKCSAEECDIYYAEVLAGRFYVGYLYTLINEQTLNKLKKNKSTPDWKEYVKVTNFCPFKIQSSYEAQSILFQSRCQSESQITVFNMVYSYSDPTITILEIPEDLREADTIEFALGNFKYIPRIINEKKQPILYRKLAYLYSRDTSLTSIYLFDQYEFTFKLSNNLVTVKREDIKRIFQIKFVSLLLVLDYESVESTRKQFIWYT